MLFLFHREICLSLYIVRIKEEYLKLSEKYGAHPVKAVNQLLFTSFSLPDILTLKKWTVIWSTYALYDPSYANQESFGFFVDFGNGWNTLLPSILCLLIMTFQPSSSSSSFFSILTARHVGIIGMLKYYQEFYGTVMYVVSYLFNKRYQGRSTLECCLVVGISNSLWFFFPAFGMMISYQMIVQNNFDMFTNVSASSMSKN